MDFGCKIHHFGKYHLYFDAQYLKPNVTFRQMHSLDPFCTPRNHGFQGVQVQNTPKIMDFGPKIHHFSNYCLYFDAQYLKPNVTFQQMHLATSILQHEISVCTPRNHGFRGVGSKICSKMMILTNKCYIFMLNT